MGVFSGRRRAAAALGLVVAVLVGSTGAGSAPGGAAAGPGEAAPGEAATGSSAAATAAGPGEASGLSEASGLGAEPIGNAERSGLGAELPGVAGLGLVPALGDPDRLVTAMVELEGAPVAVRQREARDRGAELSDAERTEARSELAARQAALLDDIGALGGRALSHLHDAYNGIKVQLPARALPQLAALPGARDVLPLTRHLPATTTAPTLPAAVAAWQASGSAATGRGVRIAVIDTGVDYLHADFGGPGRPELYAANDPAVVEPGSFPTAKVVGGYDFVGDAYDASGADPTRTTPRPDADPMDCNGHGTHVAGTAAGSGVLADGRPYNGPYDATAGAVPFTVAPGVAPEATVLALKVFGCEGTTDVTVEAIDWAVAHDADVINLSLGAGFGSELDPSSVAATNAVLAGVVVVAAAGNDGESRHIAGSPAAGLGVIAVGAVDTVETLPMATLTVGGVAHAVLNANESAIAAPVTATLAVLADDPVTEPNESRGCAASDFGGVRPGDVAVTRRGTCPRSRKAELGQAAGAAAVVLLNNESGLPPLERPIPGVTIPFLGARGEDTAAIAGAAGQAATIEAAAAIPNPAYRRAASFTSAGPTPGVLKPEVAAPGVGILSADAGSGTGAVGSSGTSMASPYVAGVAALVGEAHPDWPADLVSAAVVTTADPALVVEPVPWRVGAGLVQPATAARARVVASGDPLSPSLSFRLLEGDGPLEATRAVTVWNLADAPADVTVRIELAEDGAGGAVSAAAGAAQLTVPPGGAQRVPLTLRVDPRLLVDGPRPIGGRVVLEPVVAGQPEPTLRLPFVAVAKATSALTTAPAEVDVPPTAEQAWFTTANPAAVPGTLDVYAWGLADATGEPGVADVRAVGVQAFPGALGGRGLGVFAIATETVTANPASTEWDVLADVDEDGTYDFAVIGIDLGLVAEDQLSGTFAAVTVELASGRIVDARQAGGGLDTSVVLLPFELASVGIDPFENPSFDYVAAIFPLGAAGRAAGFDVVDGSASFDAYREAIETGQFATVAPGQSVNWTARLRRDAAPGQPPRGLMVVSLENRTGATQAQLIPLRRSPG